MRPRHPRSLSLAAAVLAETRVIITLSGANEWKLTPRQYQRLDQMGKLILREGTPEEQDEYQRLITVPLVERRDEAGARYTYAPRRSAEFEAYSTLYGEFMYIRGIPPVSPAEAAEIRQEVEVDLRNYMNNALN